jgi:protein-L-isoaspartate(D-aspartate) O-methyltransferase
MQSAAEYRHHMIDGQLEPNRVLAPAVISAMGVVKREAFVPEAYANAAYLDEPIPLTEERYLLAPMLLGQMLQALNPKSGENILVMNAGTGYSAAVLAQLGCTVMVLEESQELANKARLILSQQGMNGIEVHAGPLEMGLSASAPYSKILVEGATEHVPAPLKTQLAEGGVLAYVALRDALPEGATARGDITTIQGREGQFITRTHDDVACPAIESLSRKEGFQF